MVGRGDRVICDSAEHASIIDGATLSGAEFRSYRHGRLDRLRGILGGAESGAGNTLVAIDGVFTSDGSVCDLPAVVELCEDHGAALLVDEAHATGILGERHTGAAEMLGVESRVAVRTGTFSKALGSCGGFIVGSAELLDRMRLRARPLIFSAAPVPAALAAALAAVRICRSPEGAELAERVRSHSRRLRSGLASLGLHLRDPGPGTTAIIAIEVGEDVKAMSLWKELFDAGLYVNAVMYPAARPGRGMVRLNVMATHETAHLDEAVEILRHVLEESEPGFFLPDR
jgi:8-amino-7-oxononanoate synthase